ncbi:MULTISPECIES: hypothetical protein [Streptomyces]|uniref:hypothetical protein n=1 Tax=Streptomyces TaxID=1883 RepID=UPI0005BC35F0|nr:hypothetical protein [Streptomyces sp. NRRL F-5193]
MFEIEIDVDSLKVDSVDPVFVAGEVRVAWNGQVFPHAAWTDAPLSVIGSLGTAIEQIRAGRAEADMYFFEGPYFVKLSATGGPGDEAMVRVTGLRDHWSEENGEDLAEIVADGVVPLGEIEEAHRRTMGRLIAWCEESGHPGLLPLLRRMSRL